jgi:hypothetical protein
MSIIQTLNGQQINVGMIVSCKMAYKIIDIQNSVYDMEVKYDRLSMTMNLPNGTMDFSSENTDKKDIFSSVLSTLKKYPFQIKMTKTGKVTEVKNIETLFSNMFDNIPNITDVQKEQIKSQLTQAYGEKTFKGNLEMCSAIFSDSMVSKSDKWIVKTNLESIMSANIVSTYQLKEANDSYCLISGTSTIETVNKDTYTESNGMPIKFNLSGTITSDIKINKKSGWVIESKINEIIKGTTQIKDNPKVPGGMTIPMTINSEMKITGI